MITSLFSDLENSRPCQFRVSNNGVDSVPINSFSASRLLIGPVMPGVQQRLKTTLRKFAFQYWKKTMAAKTIPIYLIVILVIIRSAIGIITGVFIPEIKNYVISAGAFLGVIAGTAFYSYSSKEKDSEK